MPTSARILAGLVRALGEGEPRGKFYDWALSVLGGGEYCDLAQRVWRLCDATDALIVLVPGIGSEELNHYQLVLRGVARAFSPPHCNAEAGQTVGIHLSTHIPAFLGTIDREIVRAGLEREIPASKVTETISELEGIATEISELKMDKPLREFISAHVKRVAELLSAYDNFGPAYIDRVLKSFVADISMLHRQFEAESETSKVLRRLVSIVSGVVQFAPLGVKLISNLDDESSRQLPPR